MPISWSPLTGRMMMTRTKPRKLRKLRKVVLVLMIWIEEKMGKKTQEV
jgi:hypothetical protein